MGKKTKKIPFLSKIITDSSFSSRSSPWPWPGAYCQQPRTLSFRTTETMFKTISSAYVEVVDDSPISSFTNSSESRTTSSSTNSDESGQADSSSIETVIKGLRSERLFFEPGETSSILEEAKSGGVGFKQSLVLSMDSKDPYEDFKKSMEEMVAAHGLMKDWDGLEELLCCYLRVNAKSNHGYIVGAFVDFLVRLSFTSTTNGSSCSCTTSPSPSSPLSFYTSSCSDDSSSTLCVSSLEAEEEENIDICHCSSSSEAENKIKEK